MFLKLLEKLGRKKFNILIDKDSNPIGEKWSFDEENSTQQPLSRQKIWWQ